MSPTYRIERETMFPGQEVPTFRIVVALPPPRKWGTVQAGLKRTDADDLLRTLRNNEAKKTVVPNRVYDPRRQR